MSESESTESSSNFIIQRIESDLASDSPPRQIVTRFPPEPNGYLHIGHAKSICLNFGIAGRFDNARCNLRFDDTNPLRESEEFVAAIEEDVRWLGFEWGATALFASDYFQTLYELATSLIERGLAYVCSLSGDEIRESRGTLTEPGRNSPYRERSVADNLALFEQMRAGDFADGVHVLRAKIDMASPNLNLRDPVIYRIRHVAHQRTGDVWCIYPMYDFAHSLSDAIEGITHSLCTLEFEDHRALYDWLVGQFEFDVVPQQIEFSRLNLEYTMMSKRRLVQLVEENHVEGWDDPRMPTVKGMRRRGYPPGAIREFCERVGVTRKENIIELGYLESVVREHLDRETPRRMAVIKPLKVIIENYPSDVGDHELLTAQNHPNRPELGQREIAFAREIYIEADDFMIDPPGKYRRLAPGREVRLRYAYIVKCVGYETDDRGNVVLVRCTYDPETRSGQAPDGRKVKGTIHWVNAGLALDAEVRLYGPLFDDPEPGSLLGDRTLAELVSPNSLEMVSGAKVEPALGDAAVESSFQFERLGYFTLDGLTRANGLVFNRTVALRDSWAKTRAKS